MRIRRTLLALAAIPALGLSLYGIQAAHGATAIHLPFPAGTAISIIQGYNGGTHQGVERYSLDLTRDDGKTSGSPALAPAAGTVVWSYPPGTQTGCIGIQIDGGDGLHEMLCHVILNHSYANGEHVGGGQVVGSVGAPGTVGNNGVSHIHLQLYRIINGDRSPVPFASPGGVPLDGVSLPPSTGFSQWACSGDRGAGCHITSQNGAPTASSATPGGGTITSTSNSSTAGATVSSPRQAGSGLAIGVRVQVSGTGDCLRVHASASMSASQVYCLPDGTQAVITDGPQTGDGYTWYKLGDLGWSVADFLVPLNGGNSVPVPVLPIAPAAPAPTTAAPVVTTPPSVATATAPSSAAPTGAEPPIGVSITVGSAVVVAGTGDCLNVHDQAGTSGIVVDCIPDGTAGTITDGPIGANGYTWWRIDDRGWVVGDYLKAQ